MATWILTGSPENYAATAAGGYPWRSEAEPELVLEEAAWLPAESLKEDLEHIRKWPAEHWTLAFQGQLRTLSEHDADVLLEAMRARQVAGVGR